MPTTTNVGRRFRVGLVVLIALFATMVGIFMIGQRANLFRKKFPYQTRFESAAGLIAGNVVSLNGVVVGRGSIIGAGTLIPEKTIIEPNSLWLGSPGKFRRQLEKDDEAMILRYAENYLGYKKAYLRERTEHAEGSTQR